MGETKVKILVTDLDGVLTDGTLTIDNRGEKLFKTFHTRDVRAIRELVANGIEVFIASADDSGFGRAFAEKVGAIFVYMRDKSKIRDVIGSAPFWAVGDDAWDIPMLKLADRAFCPEDAANTILLCDNITRLSIRGGKGVIAQILPFLI